MPCKGSKVAGTKPAPQWWEWAVLDLWVSKGKPSNWQSTRFHKEAKDVIEAAYVDIDDAPDVEKHDGCKTLGEKYVKAYKEAPPRTIKQKITAWAKRECIPIGAVR